MTGSRTRVRTGTEREENFLTKEPNEGKNKEAHKMNIIQQMEKAQMRTDLPEVNTGDTVRVYTKFREGAKERVQPYEGVVIRINRGMARSTVTVRKVSYGTGVERIIPLHSPNLVKIEVLKRARVRRSRIYFLRDRTGKRARLKEIKQYPSKKKKA
jgi:large subunit ribosomal protein L19